jgi:hypothetical protein
MISERDWLESEINELERILLMIPFESVIERMSIEGRLEEVREELRLCLEKTGDCL